MLVTDAAILGLCRSSTCWSRWYLTFVTWLRCIHVSDILYNMIAQSVNDNLDCHHPPLLRHGNLLKQSTKIYQFETHAFWMLLIIALPGYPVWCARRLLTGCNVEYSYM